MTFEEDFPSIPDSDIKWYAGASYTGEGSESRISLNTVQKYCNDKQCIKDAIEEQLVCDYDDHYEGEGHSDNCGKCNLIKQLNLTNVGGEKIQSSSDLIKDAKFKEE